MEDIKIDSEFWQIKVKKAIKKYPNRAVDIFHCFSPSQKESKEWLIKCLNDYITVKKIYDIAILGSWYGYLSYLLEKQFFLYEEDFKSLKDLENYAEKFSYGFVDLNAEQLDIVNCFHACAMSLSDDYYEDYE